MRFALFGKMQTTRRRVWRQLVQVARTETIVVAVQREVDGYLRRLDTVAYAHELPRTQVDLRRLVVVPRLFVNAEVCRRINAALQPAFAAVEGRESLRVWFAQTLIDSIEAAVVRAWPSPWRPLPAGDSWIAVGVNEQFEWRIPFAGPGCPGHYYALELTPWPITRAVRKATREAIARLEASLPLLSRINRDEILRKAGWSLEQLAQRNR